MFNGTLAARQYSYGVLAIMVLAVIAAVAAQNLMPVTYESYGSDYNASYAPLARHLLAQGSIPRHVSAARYPPGYSLVLAATFAIAKLFKLQEETIIFIQLCLFASITAILVIVLARLIWNKRGALLVGLLWVTYPLAIMFYRQPLSEQPYLIMMLCSVIALIKGLRQPDRWVWYVLAGGCTGVAMLIRPAGIGLGVIYALLTVVLAQTSMLKRAGLATLVLTASLIPVAPWEIWLYGNTHQVIPLSIGGGSSIRDGMTYGVRDDKSWREGVNLPDDVRQMQSAYLSEVGGHRDTTATMNAVWKVFREFPIAAMKHFLIKTARSWYATDSQQYEPLILMCQIVYLGLCIVGGVLLWKHNQPAHPIILSIGILTFYTWSMTILVLSIVRYMVPIMPLLFMLIPGITLFIRNQVGVEAITADLHEGPLL